MVLPNTTPPYLPRHQDPTHEPPYSRVKLGPECGTSQFSPQMLAWTKVVLSTPAAPSAKSHTRETYNCSAHSANLPEARSSGAGKMARPRQGTASRAPQTGRNVDKVQHVKAKKTLSPATSNPTFLLLSRKEGPLKYASSDNPALEPNDNPRVLVLVRSHQSSKSTSKRLSTQLTRDGIQNPNPKQRRYTSPQRRSPASPTTTLYSNQTPPLLPPLNHSQNHPPPNSPHRPPSRPPSSPSESSPTPLDHPRDQPHSP